ncbi:hypothetical protein EKK58_09375 [Candidatus Dependentiae bacterium]|nr:MAG: hypothetical protein EKK58_09375 [Candidatus Dependentiae bacterium]
MTDSEMLKEVIQRATDGGWEIGKNLNFTGINELIVYLDGASLVPSDLGWIKFKLNEFLFNHDFAKALWGEPRPTIEHSGKATSFDFNKGWQYHLQQMVISENPIKYAYDNTKGKE